MSWTIRNTVPTLAVPDLDLALAFYETLGFQVGWRWPEDETTTHIGLVLGDASLHLLHAEPAERADVTFIVDDVDACYEAVLATEVWKKADLASDSARRRDCPPARALFPPEPPEEQSYGLREFRVLDPWGHHFTFAQARD